MTNLLEPEREIQCDGLIDTGAFGLILPLAWKERLGPLSRSAAVEVETADQRSVTAEVCGPVEVQVGSFRKIVGEVAFLDMEPRGGGY